jgi:hypothetical protein
MAAQIDVHVGAVPEGWRHARLIPTFGIRNQQEQEKRATSCLLAVVHGVPEFGHALLKELDAPKVDLPRFDGHGFSRRPARPLTLLY